MKGLITTLLSILNITTVPAQEMSRDNLQVVTDFINCIKYQRKEKLSEKIMFPFERRYPIPSIKNRQEFLKRYNEVFDDSLTKMIINSRPSDWSEVGWRGIMLLDGDLWLDYDGRLLGINYQSKAERKKREDLIKADKSTLHESVNAFKEPICLLETKQYRVRIDDLGESNYRFASWHINAKMSTRPDIIIEKGQFIPEGSGGNCRYEFKNGNYIYDCSIIVMAENNSPPALLTIYKDSVQVLSQRARIITK